MTDQDDEALALMNAKMPINPNGEGAVFTGQDTDNKDDEEEEDVEIDEDDGDSGEYGNSNDEDDDTQTNRNVMVKNDMEQQN